MRHSEAGNEDDSLLANISSDGFEFYVQLDQTWSSSDIFGPLVLFSSGYSPVSDLAKKQMHLSNLGMIGRGYNAECRPMIAPSKSNIMTSIRRSELAWAAI